LSIGFGLVIVFALHGSQLARHPDPTVAAIVEVAAGAPLVGVAIGQLVAGERAAAKGVGAWDGTSRLALLLAPGRTLVSMARASTGANARATREGAAAGNRWRSP
jgi:hypothetical protein